MHGAKNIKCTIPVVPITLLYQKDKPECRGQRIVKCSVGLQGALATEILSLCVLGLYMIFKAWTDTGRILSTVYVQKNSTYPE